MSGDSDDPPSSTAKAEQNTGSAGAGAPTMMKTSSSKIPKKSFSGASNGTSAHDSGKEVSTPKKKAPADSDSDDEDVPLSSGRSLPKGEAKKTESKPDEKLKTSEVKKEKKFEDKPDSSAGKSPATDSKKPKEESPSKSAKVRTRPVLGPVAGPICARNGFGLQEPQSPISPQKRKVRVIADDDDDDDDAPLVCPLICRASPRCTQIRPVVRAMPTMWCWC